MSLEPARLLAPYLAEAELNPKAEHYGGWVSTGLDGHTFGHRLSACSMMFSAGGGNKFKQRVDTIISDPERAQNTIGTGYENGYEHSCKQSLLLPVEWTKDGRPIIKPAGENVGRGMPLSDNFIDSELGNQRMYPPKTNPGKISSLLSLT